MEHPFEGCCQGGKAAFDECLRQCFWNESNIGLKYVLPGDKYDFSIRWVEYPEWSVGMQRNN